MNSTSTNGRALAIVTGMAFLAGGLTILLGPVLLTPAQWGQYHVLTMLMIGGTIAAGHLTKTAWKSATYLSCVGFLTLFVAGTTLVVYNSVGRQAEQHDTVTLEAEARNSLIEDKRRDIEGARERLAKAEANADRERGTKCKTRCQDWEKAAGDARQVIKVLESEIKVLGAPKPVDAKATKAGELAAVFGFDRNRAAAIAALIEPFLWTIFFEIGSIVSLGFAFRPVKVDTSVRPVQVSDTSGQSDFPHIVNSDMTNVRLLFEAANDDPSGPKGGTRATPKKWTKDELIAELKALEDSGLPFPAQQRIVEEYGVARATLSDWLKDSDIKRSKEGRRKVVGA